MHPATHMASLRRCSLHKFAFQASLRFRKRHRGPDATMQIVTSGAIATLKGVCSKVIALPVCCHVTLAGDDARCSARPITNKLTLVRRDLRGFLKSERCHLASQRSGSGGGPGLAGSKPAGYRGLRFLLLFLPFFAPTSAAAHVKTWP